jgi:hypothetical protein
MNYQERLAADAKVFRENKQEVLDRVEISNFFERHPEVIECDANVAAIRRYLADTDVTEENLEGAYAYTELNQQLARQTPQESKKAIEQKIVALLSGSSPGTIAHEKSKFPYQSIEQLREKLKGLELKQEMKSKTPEELRAIVRSRDATLPELPSEISGFQIRNMLDASQLRHLIKKYGADAVTRRANEKGKNG